MLLVCVNRNSVAHDAITRNRRFAINVLTARQQRLAASFAGSNRYGPAYERSVDSVVVRFAATRQPGSVLRL
jgi:flavin reductase (DIM6/NTAB) family NADH-FMN oxidoreductase RutF